MQLMYPLTTDALLEAAQLEAGLDDFGSLLFIPALRHLVDNVNTAWEDLNERGQAGIVDSLLRLLVNRLRMQRDTRIHPEIRQQALLPPAAIIGLPRTGSTKLQRMLASGKGMHEVILWQGFSPAPTPGPVEGDIERRKDAAAAFIASLDMFAPDSQKGHRLVVEEAEEEYQLLNQTFESPAPITFFPLYTWVRYIQRIDKTEMYEHLKWCLQYLQWQFHQGNSRPWLLKFPANLGNESYMSRTFPGIRYVVTHRDPLPVMASLVRLHMGTHQLNCKTFDEEKFTAWALDEFANEMDRHLDWREGNPDARVMDVGFKDIVKDGMATARNIYEFLDLPWDRETEREVRAWLAENDQQKEKLEYNLSEMLLNESECRDRFALYCERFGALL